MKKRYIICSLLGTIFTILLLAVIFKNELYIDNYIIHIVNAIKSETMTNFFKFITIFASSKVVILLTLIIGVYYYFKKKLRYSIVVFINMVNIVFINQIIKYSVQRTRPVNALIEETGYSFPSGHSMASIGFYGMIIYLISKSKLNKTLKYVINILLSILIFLIGLSRIYLGVHYPSDVLAGFAIAGLYLIIFITFIKFEKES